MSKKTIVIISVVVNLILLSLVIYYKKEDKRYISKVTEKDNISMLKIVGEETEVIKQVPQSGQWSMSYTCDDENAELYWNEKKRTVVAKNISATECTLIFRESDAIFRMISMYVDGEYVTELDSTKKYEIESYECSSYDSNHVTNGLYYTSDLTKTEGGKVVYYYRGAVENNYVIFGTHQTEIKEVRGYLASTSSEYDILDTVLNCSIHHMGYEKCVEVTIAEIGTPICWRIVRTNEDGSIRLRYGGAATQTGNTYTCPQTGTKVSITDSLLDAVKDYKSSYLMNANENWYRDNIAPNKSLASLVADSPYCNDMSERANGSDIYFGAYDRLSKYGTNAYNPQYKCPNSAHAYTVEKGDLTYPIGLLTADEVAYAGGVYDQSNSSYYLYANWNYWTMSPAFWENGDLAYYAYIVVKLAYTDAYNGAFYEKYYTDEGISLIPIISLKNEAKVKSGTGLYNDPYIIKTN